MRNLLLVLLFCGLAFADDRALTVEQATALLGAEQTASRLEGVRALSKLGSEEALRALLPVLEDREIGTAVADAFRSASRALAVRVLDSALLDPEIAVGHYWVYTRAELGREPDGGGGFVMLNSPHRVVLSDEERQRLLSQIARALPVKQREVLAPSFCLLATFHHEASGLPDAVARSWTVLDYETRAYLLSDECWPQIRSDAVRAVLPKTPLPDEATPWHREWEAYSLGLKRLVESGSPDARKLVLSDMLRSAPLLSKVALLSLPDEFLPEMDGVWLMGLRDREFRNLERLCAMIERYATNRLAPDMLALYRSAEWACDIQASLLRYLLKHERETALEEIEKALARRGGKHTGCYRYTLFETLPSAWGKDAEALALKYLDDEEQDVQAGAAAALVAAGSVAAFEPVFQFILGLDPDGPRESVLRYQLLMSLMEREAWMNEDSVKARLMEALTETERTGGVRH